MNWYKKSNHIKKASATFYIGDEGSHKIAQPMNILSLCHEMIDFFDKNKMINDKFYPTTNHITPDGNDYNNFEGTINFYMTPSSSLKPETSGQDYWKIEDQIREIRKKLEENDDSNLKIRMQSLEDQITSMYTEIPNEKEDVFKAVDYWIQDKKMLGYKIDVKEDISSSGAPVLRINILENPSKKIEEMPSVNVSRRQCLSIIKCSKYRSRPFRKHYFSRVASKDTANYTEPLSRSRVYHGNYRQSQPSNTFSTRPYESRYDRI